MKKLLYTIPCIVAIAATSLLFVPRAKSELHKPHSTVMFLVGTTSGAPNQLEKLVVYGASCSNYRQIPDYTPAAEAVTELLDAGFTVGQQAASGTLWTFTR